MRPASLLSLAAIVALSAPGFGCGGASTSQPSAKPNKKAPKRPARHAVGAEPHRDARIGSYVSDSMTFDTSAYWIEGPAGVVLVDTGFLTPVALDLVERAETATGKTVTTAIVLHANPDKFNGTAALQARGVEVLTSQQVLGLIPAVHQKRVKWFGKRYAPDYPLEQPAPTAFGAETTTLEAAGLALTAHVLGAGCSGAHVALQFEGHLFVGDLVAHENHAWMELGLIDDWQATLDRLVALQPTWVHPGRGPSGGPELLTAQKAYLADVKARVAALGPQGAPDDARLKPVRAALIAAYPGYGYPFFLGLGLPAVWRSLAAADGPASGESR